MRSIPSTNRWVVHLNLQVTPSWGIPCALVEQWNRTLMAWTISPFESSSDTLRLLGGSNQQIDEQAVKAEMNMQILRTEIMT